MIILVFMCWLFIRFIYLFVFALYRVVIRVILFSSSSFSLLLPPSPRLLQKDDQSSQIRKIKEEKRKVEVSERRIKSPSTEIQFSSFYCVHFALILSCVFCSFQRRVVVLSEFQDLYHFVFKFFLWKILVYCRHH